jgi:MMP 1-O-methyltransferase
MDPLSSYLRLSAQIPGWIRGEQAEAVARASLELLGAPTIVQIGTFFGSAAVLLAGARKIRGAGRVYCIDPFDCSGDTFSVPYYQRILADAGGGPLREHFNRNIEQAGLGDWVEVIEGRAEDVARGWSLPIDMLALGGDQSPVGARTAYDAWSPFLRAGGTIAVHNSAPGQHAQDHDGNRRIVVEEIIAPVYVDAWLVGGTTFARRADVRIA